MTVDTFTSKFEGITSPVKGVRLPVIKVDLKYKKELKLPEDCSNFEFLRSLCKKGFLDLKLDKKSKEYEIYGKRIKYELEIVEELGFVDYFLLVWDVANFCRENSIATGFGRGSAPSSLILYLIGITRIDPIKHGLYFERFISKTRSKKTIIDGVTYFDGSLLCDIDYDIAFYERIKVVDYLNNKYKGKVCKILTLNTLSTKLLIKEVGKVLGMKSEEDMSMVTNLIPKSHGIVKDLKEAYDESKDFKDWCDKNPLIYETALKLKDLNKNASVHASATLLSFDNLEDCCPTQLTSDKEEVSGYDMNWVATFAIKLDLLGLRCVSVIDDCCKLIGIKPEDINLDDPIIYQNLYDIKTPHGIFQIESESGWRVCKKVKPKNFEEVSAVNSLNRPGSMMFVDDYAKFTNNGVMPEFDIDSEKLKNILAETGGVILFQETLMRIAKEVFELSLDDAETIRKACGKKLQETMNKFEKIILSQGEKLNIPKSAKFYWDILNASAAYSFNKCLSLDTVVKSQDGYKIISEIKVGEKILAFDEQKKANHFVEVKDKIFGREELFEVVLEGGKIIHCSMKHKLLTNIGMQPLSVIIQQNLNIITDENEESFRDIEHWNGLYKIGCNGSILSQQRKGGSYRLYGGGQISPFVDKCGYYKIELKHKNNKKKYFVHRLIAKAFIPNPTNLPCVNHKNGNKMDNSLSNLEWVTIKDNNLYAIKTGLNPFFGKHIRNHKGENHPSHKLNNHHIILIREQHLKGVPYKELSHIFNVNYSHIRKICLKKAWKHI